MARSDLLLDLVRAASQSDQVGIRRSIEALVADERLKQHHVLANRLEEYLGASTAPSSPVVHLAPDANGTGASELLHSRVPRRTLSSLVLSKEIRETLGRLVDEQTRRELLRAHGLEPRHKVLLVGPPGNGKTSVAEALAEALLLPMYVVRYEGIVGSYLGETSARLKRVFDFVRTRACLLFFDEFDTLGKERGDPHDTGEIKRVVSALLLQIDDLPSHVVVVTATNHAELLDRAAWRRFEVRLRLPPPTPEQVEDRISEIAARGKTDAAPDDLVRRLYGANFSDLEMIELEFLRRLVLDAGHTAPRDLLVDEIRSWVRQRDELTRADA